MRLRIIALGFRQRIILRLSALIEAFNRRRAIFISLLLFFCLLPSSAGCAPLEKVRLQLKWYHQFQFAGYYAAQAKGFYRDEGLDVELIEGSKENSPYEMVLRRKADFGVHDGGDLIYRRLKGEPLVAVSAIFQHSSYVLVSKKSSGIRHPADLVGRTVEISQNTDAAQILAMFRREGVMVNSVFDQEPVRFTPLSWKLEDLVEGRVDAVLGYTTSEMLLLKKLYGIEPAALNPLEYGIDFYGDTLFTSNGILKEKPDLVARFRRASMKGWKYAMANQEEVVDMILALSTTRQKRPDRETLLDEAGAMDNIVLPTLVEMGNMNPGRWERMAQVYQELGMVTSTGNLNGFIYEEDAEKQEMKKHLRLLGIVLGCLGLLALIGLFWVRQLRSQVNLRTKELQEKHEAQLNILSTTLDGFWLVDNQGNLLDVNPSYVRMSGYSREELLGIRVTDLEALESAPEITEHIRRVFETGSDRFETVHRRKDGSTWNVEVSVTYRETRGGQFFTFLRDITERKKAEDVLRESEARYRQLVEYAPAAIYEADLTTGRLLSVNEVLCEYSGYTRDELLALHPLDLMPEESQKIILQRMAGYAAGEPVPTAVEYKARSKSGREFWISTNAKYFYQDGLPVRATVVAYDITERKRAEEEKRRLEERSRKVVEDIFRFIPEGVLVFSRKMELLRQNKAFRELLGGYAKRLGFAEDELENLIVDKIKAAMGDKNIKEIRISRKHETGEQT